MPGMGAIPDFLGGKRGAVAASFQLAFCRAR
jgi:hypothetical protein